MELLTITKIDPDKPAHKVPGMVYFADGRKAKYWSGAKSHKGPVALGQGTGVLEPSTDSRYPDPILAEWTPLSGAPSSVTVPAVTQTYTPPQTPPDTRNTAIEIQTAIKAGAELFAGSGNVAGVLDAAKQFFDLIQQVKRSA